MYLASVRLLNSLMRLAIPLWYSSGVIRLFDSIIPATSFTLNTLLANMDLANMIFQDVHYINNETAAANLEMAQIKSIADAPNEVM